MQQSPTCLETGVNELVYLLVDFLILFAFLIMFDIVQKIFLRNFLKSSFQITSLTCHLTLVHCPKTGSITLSTSFHGL